MSLEVYLIILKVHLWLIFRNYQNKVFFKLFWTFQHSHTMEEGFLGHSGSSILRNTSTDKILFELEII